MVAYRLVSLQKNKNKKQVPSNIDKGTSGTFRLSPPPGLAATEISRVSTLTLEDLTTA